MKANLRPGTPDDLSFVYSAWLKSYRNNPHVRSSPNLVYYRRQHDLIEELLAKSAVIVAHADDDPNQILGFAVFEERKGLVLCHYVYVKQLYRGEKLASALLNAVPRIDFVTHLNGPMHPHLRKVGAVYDPYLLFL